VTRLRIYSTPTAGSALLSSASDHSGLSGLLDCPIKPGNDKLMVAA
jgi:hypothetical protein